MTDEQKAVLLRHYHEDLQEYENRLTVYRNYQDNRKCLKLKFRNPTIFMILL